MCLCLVSCVSLCVCVLIFHEIVKIVNLPIDFLRTQKTFELFYFHQCTCKTQTIPTCCVVVEFVGVL